MATDHYYTQAIWSANTSPKQFPKLSGDLEVDVAIIGGGITGISTAYNLARAGKSVAVLEAMQVGMGTTGSSTGNLYSPTGQLHTIASKHNDETMQTVATSRVTAVDFIEQRVKEFNIDCEFVRVPWYYFTTKEDTSKNKQIENELEAAKKAGLPASDQVPANFPYPDVAAMAHVAQQAQFNPLRYVQQFAAAIAGENCQIYEHTKVLDIEDGDPCVLRTNSGTVRAKKVVQATHTPKGIYAVHTAMEVYREYALSVRVKGNLPANGTYWHMLGKELYSVRPYSNELGNFLIVLDASHKIGHVEHTEKSFKHVEEYMRAHFDVDGIEHSWAAQNYKPADTIPFIGTSPLQNNVYIATGFSADGLTYGTLASMIISDAILGKENQWAKTYDPKRFTPVASAPKFIKENVDVAVHLVKDWLFKGDEEALQELSPGEAKILDIDNEKVAAYCDNVGRRYAVSAVCTHMGCLVHWNNGEKSWDCPCHGSRFSLHGEVLEGPAIKNLQNKMEDNQK